MGKRSRATAAGWTALEVSLAPAGRMVLLSARVVSNRPHENPQKTRAAARPAPRGALLAVLGHAGIGCKVGALPSQQWLHSSEDKPTADIKGWDGGVWCEVGALASQQ